MAQPELVTLGAPGDRDWLATTTASTVKVRVADGMAVPLVTITDGFEEYTVPEIVTVTALEASV